MEITTRELPPSVGINTVQKGVYEFDVDVLHLGVQGFCGEYAITSADIQKDNQYLYLRAGQEHYPDSIRRHDVRSFALGKFTRMWVEGSTIKGHVVIPEYHHNLFDAIVDLMAGTLNLGVCSLVCENMNRGERHRIIQKLWGAQVLTADGHNLCEMYGDSYSPLYELMLKAAPGTRDYIGFCASSIASEPYVAPVKQVQPAPPQYGVEMLPSLKVMDVLPLAELIDKETVKPYGKMSMTDPRKEEENDIDGA